MSAPVYGRGLIGLLKRGWQEYPEITASCFLGLAGIGVTIFNVYYYYNVIDGDVRTHRDRYVVYRHDDPRVEALKRKGIYAGEEC